MIEFEVAGVPAPQGSKVRTRWGVREDNPATRPWRTAVAWEAAAAMNGAPPFLIPLELHVLFVFPRPKSHYRTGKHADRLRDTAPAHCATKPDADKLLRAIGDSLTGCVVRDDSQFVKVVAEKIYGRPRAVIRVLPVREAVA